MAGTLEEITLTFLRERIRFDSSDESGQSTAIIECSQSGQSGSNGQEDGGASNLGGLDDLVVMPNTLVKVESKIDDFTAGLDYRFYGRWVEHYKYGRQFVAKTFVKTQPHNRVGVIRYLMQAPHVGRVIAQGLWDKFGSQAVQIVREQPDVAAAAVGGQFNESRAKEAAAHLQHDRAIENTTIDLIDLFAGRGFPKTLGKKVVEEWGNRAAWLIRNNPYLLMRFRGCGFLRCDQLFLDTGGSPARLKRQALSAWYSIARNTEGHTWFAPDVAEKGMRERISGAEVTPIKSLQLAKRSRLLAVRRDEDNKLWVAEYKKASNEQAIADRVQEWLDEPCVWPSVEDLGLSEHQQDTLSKSLVRPLTIFTGGPGTGKTYSAARVIGRLVDRFGGDSVAIACPTGKAAVRISEVMESYGVGLRARTIHSLLGVSSRSEGDGWGFTHNESNPLPYRFVVVDEASMMDVDLTSSLFRACGTGTHLLLVGDTGQLPPVGHGAPLRDLIAAGVPCGELEEIRRNSGQIVLSCHSIRSGRKFNVCGELNLEAGANLKLLPAASEKAAVERIIKTVRAIGARGLANPIWDCQVICAVNARSGLSRRDLNQHLQAALNPSGEQAVPNPFRVGDKIVCLKNSRMPVVEDAPDTFNEGAIEGRVFVANGEQGAVKLVAPNLTVAQLEAPSRLIKIPRGSQSEEESSGGDGNDTSSTGCQWDLAYAISCHKGQGSQWPVVIVVLDQYPGAQMVCSRQWLYTAISRAENVCFLAGKLTTAYDMISREAIGRRKTFLAELIGNRANRAAT